MKTLTYGILPSFDDFAQAFETECGTWFDMRLSDSDARMFEATGLECLSRYTAAQAYDLLGALVAESETFSLSTGESTQSADWAGDFASSILTTLGFEWI